MSDIFLSYSREDLAKARLFALGFEREELSVWWDQALDTGVAFDRVTEKALEDARAVVVLWSKHSVDSRWVRAEATLADDNGKLIPVTIEPCKRPIMFHLTQTADLTHWKGDIEDASWRDLIASLRRNLGKAPSIPAPAVVSSKTRKPLGIAIALAAVLVVGVAAFVLSRPPGKPAQPGEAIATQTSNAPVTLAVLPFANLSSDPEQEYFSEGLTEEIRSKLAQIAGLRVTGRTSSFSFKGKNEDARAIGKTLGVANLLEGSIRKEGNQLRITAQLIDSSDGAEQWSKTYERTRDDVFKVQQDIAVDVAQALKVTLGITEEARIPGMTRNPDAYEAFLAANAAAFKFEPGAARQSIKEYQRAIALDPAFALAWANLAGEYSTVAPLILRETATQTWIAKADEAIAQARRIAPDAYYVHMLLAGQCSARNQWLEAGRHYRDAASAAKSQGVSLPFRGKYAFPPEFSVYTGKFKDAIEVLEAITADDPLSPREPLLLSEAYSDAGNFEAAFAERDRALKLGVSELLIHTGTIYTAMATRDRRRIDQGLAALRASGLDDSSLDLAVGALLDRPEQALELLHSRAQHTLDIYELGSVAVWMAYFGDSGGALNVLRSQKVRNAGGNNLAVFIWRPVMRDMRKLPGFKDLVRDIGMVDYWREFGWPDLCKPVGKDDFECT